MGALSALPTSARMAQRKQTMISLCCQLCTRGIARPSVQKQMICACIKARICALCISWSSVYFVCAVRALCMRCHKPAEPPLCHKVICARQVRAILSSWPLWCVRSLTHIISRCVGRSPRIPRHCFVKPSRCFQVAAPGLDLADLEALMWR